MLVFLVIALFAASACSPSTPLEPVVVSAERFEPRDNAMRITASVLISEKSEQTLTIGSVRITPDSIAVERGESVQFSAQAFREDDQAMDSVDFSWAIVDPRAGFVDDTGLFKASATPGVYQDAVAVTAVVNTPDGIKFANASASVTVLGDLSAAKLTRILILAENPTVVAGQIYRLRAVGYDENDLVIPGVRFVWQVSDPSLGRVNETGYLTVEGDQGTFPDVVSVTGIWDGERASASTDVTVAKSARSDEFLSVQVLPRSFNLDAGGRMELRALALNGLGELVVGTELRWSMVDDNAGTIDGSGQFVAGDTPGIYTEAVKVEAIIPGEQGFVLAEDFASVVILDVERSPRLARVSVTPSKVVLSPGQRIILIASPVDGSGAPAKDITIAWSLNDESAGKVDEFGSFQAALTPGEYPDAAQVIVQQVLDDEVVIVTALADVIVTGTLSNVQINPTLGTVSAGKTIHFNVAGFDENGVELTALVVLWSLEDETIGGIDSFGNFTAGNNPGLFENVVTAEVIQPDANR